MTFSTDYTEEDTFKALTRVPFLSAWESIGWRSGKDEKHALKSLNNASDDIEPERHILGGWHDIFVGWEWKDYKRACRELYARKYAD